MHKNQRMKIERQTQIRELRKAGMSSEDIQAEYGYSQWAIKEAMQFADQEETP